MDVSDAAQARAVLSAALAEFGVPDVLINAAGRAYPRRFEDVSLAQFHETLEVNLHGIWHAVQVLTPPMKARGGLIVNVSSMAGLIGVFGYTDYSASKFAVIGLSEALRSELKPHRLRVLVLCPPDTDTPGFQVENKTKPAETRAVSGQPAMRPDEVAGVLIRGMEKERFIILPGLGNRIVYLLKRLWPGLVFRFMDRTIRKVQSRRQSAL
jgi:short-subunit dehydrogenase